jgi:serine/threonine protein kinase
MIDDLKSPRIAAIEEALGGKYKIIDKIGTGGFGEVYLGEHQQLRRKVAIKILAQNLAGQSDVVKRFEREARAAATLSHPNIIDIYDVGDNGDIYYFVMKYIDGETLSERMARDKTISPGEAIHIVKQVADALDYAHDHEIIHRDIKPANIMLDEYGKPVLMDFGVARVQFEANLTKTGTLMGTPHYLPPELPLGKRVDGRSDIYSLGILLYEMLCGRPPFHDENSVALIFKHINDAPDPLNEIVPELAPELCMIVHKMIEKLPENRYQTAGEVVDALQDLTSIYPPITTAGRRSTPTGSRNTEKLLLLAQEHVQKEKFSKAIELYATISRRDPNNETAKREISELVTRMVERVRDHISKHEVAQARELLRQVNQLSFKDERLSMARIELEKEEQAQTSHKEKETEMRPSFTAAAAALEKGEPDLAMEALATLEQQPAPRDMLPEWMKRDTKIETPEPKPAAPPSPIPPSPRITSEQKVELPQEARAMLPAASISPVATPEKIVSVPTEAVIKSSGKKWVLPAIVLVVVAAVAGAWLYLNHEATDQSQTDPSLLHKLAASRIKAECSQLLQYLMARKYF